MKFNPHTYQQYAIDHILDKDVCALFLDMGLGKTVTTLTAIDELIYDRFSVSRVLIIAPLRVATSTWPSEIEKWDHLSRLTYSVVVGSEKERRQALNKQADLYIINRENVDWLVTKSGYRLDYDMLVIDELSSFKSYSAKRFKSLLKIRPNFKRVVGLTGTPSSNGLMDLWAQFRLLDLGQRLGRYITHYRNTYFVPDKRNGMVIYSYKPQDNAEERIYQAIGDMTISMKSCDHLKMPELLMNEVLVKMDKKETEGYQRFKSEMVMTVENKEIDAINAASLSNKLLQMANGSVYDEEKQFYKIHDKKLDALEDILESANGEPILVAYWFQHDLARILGRLEKLKVKSRVLKTEDDIREWNKGNVPVGLLHPASAGHGLNLQKGGHHLVWFGLTWSLELYQQTNARLYRQGQEAETVVIQHIITENTIDEDVLKALSEKDKTQERLIAAVKAQVGG